METFLCFDFFYLNYTSKLHIYYKFNILLLKL